MRLAAWRRHRPPWSATDPPGQPSTTAVLAVGSSGHFSGIYHVHWEWPRFETRTVSPRWWPWPRAASCEILFDDVPAPAAIATAWASITRGSGVKFAVTIDAEVVEEGHFGHRGTLQWRMRLREWVAVETL